MRNLFRSRLASVADLHEMFTQGDMQLQYEPPERQADDVCTKAFLNADVRNHVARLIGAGDPSVMTAESEMLAWPHPPPAKAALRKAAYVSRASSDRAIQNVR